MSSPTVFSLAGEPARWFGYAPYRTEVRKALAAMAGAAAVLALVAWVPAAQFALPAWLNVALHTLFETLSIVVSALVFSVGWHTFNRERSSSVALICNVFLAVAVLDFVHLLSFEGMPPLVAPSGAGKAIPTFLAARLLVGAALVAIAVQPWERQTGPASRKWLLASCLGIAIAISAAVVLDPGIKRLFFVPGQGLTALKIGIEYIVIGMNVAAALALLLRMDSRQPFPVVELFLAAGMAALSELCFTLYARTMDPYNTLGHAYKVLAYLLIYRALFLTLVRKPYDQLEAARQDLEDSEEKYRMLFENSLDGVVLTDLDGAVRAANPAACAMFRTTEDRMVRLGLQGVIGSGGPDIARLLEERARTGQARGDLVMRRSDGTRFLVEISSALYFDRAGRAAASTVVRDISERKKAQDEILRLNATLEQRVRERTAELERTIAELERFSYSVAHDLRAPLASISGFTLALRERMAAKLSEQERHYLARIRSGVVRMDAMIDGLLQLAHVSRSPLTVEPLDLSHIAAQALANCRELDPSRVVDGQVQPGLRAEGDRQLVTMLMDNLVRNAWKFTAKCAEARIEIGAEAGDGGVFFVRDNGAGFDMAYADKLFGVFQRLHSEAEFPGHGIGLANVRQIVARHNGRIWAEAAPAQGAVFRFTLAGPPG